MQYDLKNIKYTSEEGSEKQLWVSEREIFLNQEVCSVHAYYPYNESVTDITAVPVTYEGQTDYMYASNAMEVSKTNNRVNVQMAHALSVITLNIKKGSYLGTGSVTKVAFQGGGIAQAASMNAKTGELYDFVGVADPVSIDTEFTMDAEGQVVHTIVVPNGVTSPMKISLLVDGKEYYVVSSDLLLEQGNRYEYNLTVDEGELTLASLQVGDWGYNEAGNPVLWAGGYSITIVGDVDSMAFFNELKEDGSVRIAAYGLREGVYIQSVVCKQGGITQTYDETRRVVDIPVVEKNMVLEFDGFGVLEEHQERFFPAGTYTWTVPEGIVDQTGNYPGLVDVFLVGGGGGGGSYDYNWCNCGGGGGYTTTFRGIGYQKPASGTWEGTYFEGRDGNAIDVSNLEEIEVIVGGSGGYSQFLNENFRANGGQLRYGGSAGGGDTGQTPGSDGGNNGYNYGGQGHTTRDFGEPTGKRNAGGGAAARSEYSLGGGGSDYTEGCGESGFTGVEPEWPRNKLYGGGGGGGYGGGGGGSYMDELYTAGGDGTVLLRYWTWVKK